MTSTLNASATARPNAVAPRTLNGSAIAAFVLSILGWVPLSIPFGLVALHQIKHRRGEDGRGLAIAGLVISAVQIVIFATIFAWLIVFALQHPAQ